MSTKMTRLNLHVTDELKRRLDAHCERTGAPISEVIRRSLDMYLTEMERREQWTREQNRV
jgi:predicted DNA-binding protein